MGMLAELLTMGFNVLAVSYFDTQPAGLHVFHDAQPIMG
jgi:hypothetical protein